MKEINAKLWYNHAERDWTVELDGELFEHVSAETVDQLFEYKMMAAQQALMKQFSIDSKDDPHKFPRN